MIGLTLSLPRHRLRVQLTRRRRQEGEQPLFPDLAKLGRTRAGSKVSRFFRHIFEHRSLRALLGGNLAVLVVVTSFLVPGASALATTEPEVVTLEPSSTPLTTQEGRRFPVEGAPITQGYSFFHRGVDIDGVTGDAVYPVMAGVIERVDHSDFWYGNSVTVDHGNSVKSFYAHLKRVDVSPGEEVTLTSKIGEVGSTGRAFGDHLHFEVHKDGRVISPYSILPRFIR